MSSYSYHFGETWVLPAQFEVPDGVTLVGVEFVIATESEPIVTLTTESGVVIHSSIEGTATITVPDNSQNLFSVTERYSYEAWAIFSSGLKEVQAEGIWVVLPSLKGT